MNKVNIKQAKANKEKAIKAGKKKYLGKPCPNPSHHTKGGSIRSIAWDKDKNCWKSKSCVLCYREKSRRHRENNLSSIARTRRVDKENRKKANKSGEVRYTRLIPCINCGDTLFFVKGNSCYSCFSSRDRKRIDSPLVYIIKDKDDKIIYVGQTKECCSRFNMHKSVKSAWIKDCSSLQVILCKDELTMTTIEELLISIHKPKHNKVRKSASDKTLNQLLRLFQAELRPISCGEEYDEIIRVLELE